LDFLSKSILDLESQPKYSVINFYTAVELILKARLIAAHWSLAVSRTQEPDWDKFVAGDFTSVSFPEAHKRLHLAVKSGLNDSEIQVFDAIRKHRNMMVHFFHRAHGAQAEAALKATIASEQLTAWYLLHRLLVDRWGNVFRPWEKQVSQIDLRLRQHANFLKVVFDNIQEDLASARKDGTTFTACPLCSYSTMETQEVHDPLYNGKCWVCKLSELRLRLPCPQCKQDVEFRNEGFAICTHCKKAIEPDDVVVLLDGRQEETINCGNCDGAGMVIELEAECFLCARCFDISDTVQQCEWCSELNTGDMSLSFLEGCGLCEGRGGWKDD
jgi:hypothetical protein